MKARADDDDIPPTTNQATRRKNDEDDVNERKRRRGRAVVVVRGIDHALDRLSVRSVSAIDHAHHVVVTTGTNPAPRNPAIALAPVRVPSLRWVHKPTAPSVVDSDASVRKLDAPNVELRKNVRRRNASAKLRLERVGLRL